MLTVRDKIWLSYQTKLKISPHLAYGEKGIAGRIPENAVIIVEIEFIEERLHAS